MERSRSPPKTVFGPLVTSRRFAAGGKIAKLGGRHRPTSRQSEMFDGRNRPPTTASADSAGDGRAPSRDRQRIVGTSGRIRGIAGRWLAGYGWVALLVVAAGCVNVLSAAQHGAGSWGELPGPVVDQNTH